MKRFLSLLFPGIFLLSLCGCYDYRELNDTAMVAGIAIDPGKEANYSVSVEVIQPTGSEEKSPQGKILSQEGNNIEDCLQKLVNSATKELLFSHCKLIIFSEDLTRRGIAEQIDFFLRNTEYRADLYLAVVRGATASEMLAAGEKEGKICAYDYATVIHNSFRETGAVSPTMLYQFPMDEGLTLLPVFEEKDKLFHIAGTEGFHQGKSFCSLTLEETQSVLLLSGEYKNGEILLISEDGKEIPCQVNEVKTKRSVSRKKEITVHVSISCNILLTTLPEGFDISTEQQMDVTEETIGKLLTKKLERNWNDAKNTEKRNIYGLEIYLYRHAPSLFQKMMEENLSVNLIPECRVKLANFGFSDERIGLG